MRHKSITPLAAVLALAMSFTLASAQEMSKNVKLHINPRWSECSFQLDPALTQDVWRQFTKEGALVVYFRPLTDAKPMGVGNYEFSVLNWQTDIDDEQPTWNDTFVHPDSTHWLIESESLAFPGLTFRAGIADDIDIGAYVTKSPGANYGFWGGQVQYSFLNNEEKNWAAAARLSFVSLYGPEDFDMTAYGVDLMASRKYAVYSDWISVSPYAGLSAFLSRSHEKSAVVDLRDENVLGVRATVGAVTQISFARLAVEYSVATVNSISFKIGVGF